MDILQILLVLPPLLSTQSTSTFQGDVTADPIALTSTTSTRKASTSTSGSQTPGPSSKPAVEEEWAHVEAYLYSGNASLLSLAKCTQTYHLSGLQGSQAVLGPFLHQALDALTNAANFLNMIFQANDLRESSIREDMEWYHALVRGLMEGDPLIRRALFTFDTEPTALQPQLVLQASRPSYKSQDILLQDMSSAWERLHPPAPAPHISWYTAFKFSAQLAPTLSKRVLLNDLHTLDTPKWGRGDSYVTSQNGVHWADPPFLECDNRHFLPGWLLTLSTPFYGLKPDLSPEFRGVIRIDVNLQSFDVDQCAEGNDWFFNTHQCNRSSMHCEHIRGRGFRLGQYRCHCKEGFYSPLPATPDARVQEKRNGNGSGSSPPALPLCLPCWPGCKQCKDGAPCKVQEDWYLRAAVLTVQGFFMLLVLISMLVAYQFRRNKRIRASGLVLLETILFGSLLLYFPVFILYFKPSTFRCILLRWVRLLGFAIVYGTVTLKMYRVLKVFLSRTAHRVPYMSSTRLLKMLGVVVLTVCWFLTAWTAGALQNRDRSIPLVVSASTRQGQAFTQCDLDRWDYMMAIAEMLFLCWGSSLCSAVRMVPSAFHEPRYMSIAIHNELLVSLLFHVLRFFKPFLHPDWTLLLFFMHTHITVTVTVALLFIPKFLHVSRPLREEIAAEVYEDEVDLRRSCSYFTSSFASAWNEHNFEPDDIRDELKKLYTQLEVHKTKKMTDNNPHLPKKRSSRLGLGQSIIKRITKIPESMSRQCSREEKDVSLCGRTGSKQSSCIKRGLESASIKSSEESFNQCALLLHKSHSTYDYSKDRQSHFVDPRDVSLLDSLMRRKLAKAAFERSEIKSVDAVPFVYKSASAHNLSVDQQLLQPEPKKLQKSLSVMTSNKEGSHEQAGKSCNVEQTLDVSRAKKQDSQSRLGASISSQTLNALLSESFDKAEVCPWELEDHLPEGKSQKHVTYATGSCRSQRTLERTDSPAIQQCHLGPWDTLTMDYSKTTEDKHGGAEASDSDSESIKPQVPLSSSAPHSPVTGVGKQKEQRVFSFYGRPALSMKEASEQLPIGHQGNFAADICPWEVEDTSSSSMVMNSARFPEEIKEIEKTQRKEGLPANVCPSQEEKMVRHRSEDRSSVTNEVRGISQNQDGLKKEDPNKTTYSTKKTVDETTMKVEICPWDVVSAYIPQTNQSSIEDICPWDVKILEKEKKAQEGVLSEICPWETAEPERTFRQSEICPWEDKGSDITDSKKTDELKCTNSTQRMDNETPNIQSFVAEVCPWDVIASPQEKTQRMPTVIAEVCPWDVNQSDSPHVQLEASEPSPEGLKVMESTAEKQKSPMLWNTETDEGEKMTKMQDVSAISGQSCPLELETCQAEGKREHERNRGSLISMGESPNDSTVPRQTSITVEPCPWRFPEMSVNMQEICPWVSMSAKPSLVKQTAIQLSSEEPEAADTKEETTFVSNCSVTAKTASPDIQTTEKQDKTKGRSGVGQGLAPLATKESEGTTVRHAGTDTNEHPLERVEVTSSGELPLGFGTQSSAAAVPMLETATTETKSSKSSHEAGEAQPEHPAAYCDSFNPWHEQEVKRSLIFPNSAPWEGENTTNDAESEAEAFYFPPEL
ncbi:probable G-protein coupled receptor 179 [Scleropages formosus]|uniref:probable G-protein coupled receptor 179 n=1 Tax=Scleropages formosus TaxID=113540 RepID=UPI0010FA9222|nr:probable G-protein coupled receptor 179 [Scleropages formosus]